MRRQEMPVRPIKRARMVDRIEIQKSEGDKTICIPFDDCLAQERSR